MDEKITLVIPIYNEIAGIEKSIEIIKNFSNNRLNWKIIIVDDGSNDGTEIILSQFLSDKIKVIVHDKNQGYGAALKTGIKSSDSEYIAIIDADGTYPFDSFDEFEKFIDQNAMVVAHRQNVDGSIPLIKRIPKYFIRKFASYLTGIKIHDFNSGMRIFRRNYAMKLMNYFPNGFSFTTTITVAFASNNLSVKYLPINYMKRDGASKIKPIRDTINFFILIFRLGIYFNPFKIYGPFIIFFLLLGIALMISRIFYGEGFLVSIIICFLVSLVLLCFSMLAHSISLIFRDRLSDD